MRIKPLSPNSLSTEARYVHDEIAKLIGHSQGQVNMLDDKGALLGPFPPMLTYPQFGIPALRFIRTLDAHATLDRRVREVAILTVGAILGARFILYAHEIMGAAFGLSPDAVASLAASSHPNGLNQQESIAHSVARAMVTGHVVPSSTYKRAVELLGQGGTAELVFLIGGYTLIAMILNGFDMPAPDQDA